MPAYIQTHVYAPKTLNPSEPYMDVGNFQQLRARDRKGRKADDTRQPHCNMVQVQKLPKRGSQ